MDHSNEGENLDCPCYFIPYDSDFSHLSHWVHPNIMRTKDSIMQQIEKLIWDWDNIWEPKMSIPLNLFISLQLCSLHGISVRFRTAPQDEYHPQGLWFDKSIVVYLDSLIERMKGAIQVAVKDLVDELEDAIQKFL